MEKPVEIEILGHKAKIVSVRGQLANGVFYAEDTFQVQIECPDAPFGSTIGFFVELPVGNYGPQEFIQAVKDGAEKKAQEMMAKDKTDLKKRDATKRRQADLDSIASQIEDSIQKGKLL